MFLLFVICMASLSVFQENVQLRSVNLSYNNFFEMSGESFKSLLSKYAVLGNLTDKFIDF